VAALNCRRVGGGSSVVGREKTFDLSAFLGEFDDSGVRFRD